jgi:hypothetical protein
VTRDLTAAEPRQRQEAPLKHRAYSRRKMRGPWAREQRNLQDRVRSALGLARGATSPLRVRLIVEKAAWYRTLLLTSYEWRLAQPDPVFKDRAAGELHPVIAREEEWMSALSRLLAQLPIDGTNLFEGDLASALAARRRSGGAA